jgi:hypothetical protein
MRKRKVSYCGRKLSPGFVSAEEREGNLITLSVTSGASRKIFQKRIPDNEEPGRFSRFGQWTTGYTSEVQFPADTVFFIVSKTARTSVRKPSLLHGESWVIFPQGKMAAA